MLHAVRSTSVARPARMAIDSLLPASNRGRKDAASSNCLCWRSRPVTHTHTHTASLGNKTRGERCPAFFFFICPVFKSHWEVVQLIHRSTIRLFRFWRIVFSPFTVSITPGKRYRINGNHFTPSLPPCYPRSFRLKHISARLHFSFAQRYLPSLPLPRVWRCVVCKSVRG